MHLGRACPASTHALVNIAGASSSAHPSTPWGLFLSRLTTRWSKLLFNQKLWNEPPGVTYVAQLHPPFTRRTSSDLPLISPMTWRVDILSATLKQCFHFRTRLRRFSTTLPMLTRFSPTSNHMDLQRAWGGDKMLEVDLSVSQTYSENYQAQIWSFCCFWKRSILSESFFFFFLNLLAKIKDLGSTAV